MKRYFRFIFTIALFCTAISCSNNDSSDNSSGNNTPLATGSNAQWQTTSRTVNDTVGTVMVNAVLDQPATENIEIPYTVSGTLPGTDYQIVPTGSVIIPAGQTSTPLTIQVNSGVITDTVKSIVLTMQPPANAGLGPQATFTLYVDSPNRPGAPASLTLFDPPISPSNIAGPTISVNGVTSGNTVTLYSDSGCTQILATGTAAGSSIALKAGSIVTDGLYNFYATQKSGNYESPCSTVSASYTLDSVIATVGFEQVYFRAPESNSTSSFNIKMSATKLYDVAIQLNTAGTTAASARYNIGVSSVTIPAGETEVSVPYSTFVTGDSEGEQFLKLNIASTDSPTVQVNQSQASAVRYIYDNQNVKQSVQVAAGWTSVCVLLSDNTLHCWGDNAGDGSGQNRLSPVSVSGGGQYKYVSAGFFHLCAITTAGELKCWGQINGANVPTTVDAGTTYDQVSSTEYNTCGLTTAHEYKCLDQNQSDPNTGDPLWIVQDSGTFYKSISVGGSHFCGITQANGVRCWGSNFLGQVGDGTTNEVPDPIDIDAGTNYISIAAGDNGTCGVTANHTLKCWGQNAAEASGNDSADATAPLAIDAGTQYQWVKTAGGNTSFCAATTSNDLKCWGANDNYAFSASRPQKTPVIVDPGVKYIDASPAIYTMCGVTQSDLITKCWGGGFALPGNGLGTSTAAVTTVDNGTLYAGVLNSSNFSCGYTTAGKMKCWGYNGSGQLGNGSNSNFSIPTDISSMTAYASAAVGGSFACGLSANDKLECWGNNGAGSYGNNSTVSSLVPRAVQPSSSYRSVVAGPNFACGIDTDDNLWCWGANSDGQLGQGNTTSSLIPVAVKSGTKYSKVAASPGGYTVCAIRRSDSVLECWGSNYSGQIGNGNTAQQLSPVAIDATTQYKSVAVGNANTCAIMADDHIKCWGNNSYGNVGNGTSGASVLTPTAIDTGSTYKQLAATANAATFVCGILTDGTLKCWGNTQTTLGQVNVPTVVDGGTSYKQISAGSYNACGVTTSGVLRCWGNDNYGQLGRGAICYGPTCRPVGLETQ